MTVIESSRYYRPPEALDNGYRMYRFNHHIRAREPSPLRVVLPIVNDYGGECPGSFRLTRVSRETWTGVSYPGCTQRAVKYPIQKDAKPESSRHQRKQWKFSWFHESHLAGLLPAAKRDTRGLIVPENLIVEIEAM